MDANERVINRLKRLYSFFGASDFVECVVSVGGHAYRKDIRQAAYRFINSQFKNDPRLVLDSEVDLVTSSGRNEVHPIEPPKLRAFPLDSDIPKDELNTRIDEFFVPMAKVDVPSSGDFDGWRKNLLTELRRLSFRNFPERIPPARALGQPAPGITRIETEPGIELRLKTISGLEAGTTPKRIELVISTNSSQFSPPSGADKTVAIFVCEPRGFGETRWTCKNPPNYVARSHVLLGKTVDRGRVWDIVAIARHLHQQFEGKVPVKVIGEKETAVLAAYAALLEPEIAELALSEPQSTHMDPSAPQFLNVLRVCDIPDALGMLAPRPLTISGSNMPAWKKTSEIYSAAGSKDKLVLP